MQGLEASSTEGLSRLGKLLVSGASAQGISLGQTEVARLVRYAELLEEWGRKINLTAIVGREQIFRRHFLDSLALVGRLPPLAELPSPSLLDVGSGAGFPGVLCALCRPDLRITLSERIGKKAAFLLTLRRELGLSFEVFADDATRLPTGFGVVVSRAALPLPKWFPFAESLTAPRGYIYSMTSPSEPVPDAPPSLSLCLDMLYDIGEGQHRILAHRKAG
jgi:16S rRNA (guanine527-N7)-methyltransferase